MNRKYLALTLALTAASAHGTVITNTQSGDTLYVNPNPSGYSVVNATQGTITTYVKSGNLLTKIPGDAYAEPKTYAISPDATGAEEQPLLLDEQGAE